ncbi:tetratricopeptide repeat protein [Nitrobacter sp.]|uniref:tetratricopeptide repeat protein n=1 Tax=Nitrobacter sp. TaxID=29420 RepID=UPI0029CABD0C|nr:tetratricopeptide repeat protein [Nitrobacter sp.]
MASALDNLASVYKDEARYAEAEPLYKQALAIREKALPPVTPMWRSREKIWPTWTAPRVANVFHRFMKTVKDIRFLDLTRFLHANRISSSGQARGHAWPENALCRCGVAPQPCRGRACQKS